MSIKEQIEDFCKTYDVRYSPSRMPYTYHHDYLRSHTQRFCTASRSEVAEATKDVSEDDLWLIALLGYIDSLSGIDALFLSSKACNSSIDLMNLLLKARIRFDELYSYNHV